MRQQSLQLTLCLCLSVIIVPCVAGQCQSMRELNMSLPEATNLKCGHVCPREHGWKMLPVLWAPLEVEINCSSSSYTVLTAHTQEQLVIEASPIKWCGLHQILRDPRVCRFKLSPLQNQYLAVEPSKNGGFLPGKTAFQCVVNSTRELSITAMCLSIVGVALFYNAERLTMNEYFRLTSGSLMFMSGAILVLAFIFMRSVPYKRSLAAALTVSGTTVLAIARYLYGTWLPDAHTLLLSRPTIIYMSVTAVVGWGVTYWFDDTTNVKLNRIIKVILQLVGLMMVYLGISDERVAIGAAVVLVSSRVLWAVGRLLCQIVWLSARAIRFVLSMLLTSTWRLVSSMLRRKSRAPRPDTAASAAQQAVRTVTAHGTAASADEVSSEPDQDEDEPLLSDAEAEATTRRAGHTISGQHSGAGSPLHHKEPPPLSSFVKARQRATGLGSWVGAAAGRAVSGDAYRFPSSTPPAAAPAATNLTAAPAAAAAPKSPWSSEKVAVDLDRRQQLGSPSGTVPAKSPWSSEKVAYDVNRWQQLSPQPGAASGGVSPKPPQQQQQQQGQEGGGAVSPLVVSGKIINPETGRPIQINKSKYNEFLSRGYVPDLQNGVLVAPAGVDGGQAEVSPGRAVISGVFPAGNVRQRRSGAVTPR